MNFVGWDLGGAHLKYAQIDSAGELLSVKQIACPLWEGMPALDRALASALRDVDPTSALHGATMTGELADIFSDRDEGVRRLADRLGASLGDATLRFFAGAADWIAPAEIARHTPAVASANWYATARCLSQRLPGGGILIDVGSTTSDLIAFADGTVLAEAYRDGERLATEELVYTGVLRTPVMAIAQQVPFDGRWQGLAAERFATTGDIYRLTGQITDAMLSEQIHFDTADGAGTGLSDCARRLARMLGRDLTTNDIWPWQQAAGFLAGRQLASLRRALERRLSRPRCADLPLVGAGVGRFLVRELAQQLHQPYIDFADCVSGSPELRDYAAICAPATALAYLLRPCANIASTS
jgi:probable H4MPT-linked C1 transfer pathway protein